MRSVAFQLSFHLPIQLRLEHDMAIEQSLRIISRKVTRMKAFTVGDSHSVSFLHVELPGGSSSALH